MDKNKSASNKNIREKIIQAAAELLIRKGRNAVSTRSIAEAAGVQAPTLYRHFGDMRGLLDAVANYGFTLYLAEKRSRSHTNDPIENLRRGWDIHVGFGLSNPALYVLMFGELHPGNEFEAGKKAMEILYNLVNDAAVTGRLRFSVKMTSQMIHAAARGVTFILLEQAPADRDSALSNQVREAMLSAVILPDKPAREKNMDRKNLIISYAVALKSLLPEATGLTSGEQTLLDEWLEKLSKPQ